MTRRKIMNEQQKVELKLIHMEDVVSKEVEWLWYPYIPYGKITIVERDPGEGKTTLVLKLAAALSRGLPLPCDDDREREPIHIIYQTAEDGIDDTIKPRLEKAGADCSMIRVIDETEKELSMIDDRLEQAIVETGARLVILDPIQAYIGAKINVFVSSFRLFAPTIEEYANHVESDKTIEAGNSFRGILYEIGKLLETFKELIKEGLCWFLRLMRWKTSNGEVAPVFIEKRNGYSYSVYGYMNVDTKEYYSKELMQWEIKAGNRTGTVEQMDANVEAMARDLQEILRIGAEQKRLWEVYNK